MANSYENPDDLITDIISFLEQEREVFGDFSVQPSENKKEPETKEDPDSLSTSSASKKSVTTEPSLQENSASSSIAKKDDSFTSQEGLFNQDDSKKIYYHIDKCTSLEELEELCQQAENVLRTDLEDTQLVFGVGNPNADLVLVGEAPGAEEDRQGEPFVGKAGQLLNKILAAINFEREDVYIANILKHRPPNNRNPKPEERKRSLPFLIRQIDLIDPKLILALGKVSAQTLLDKKTSLTKMRGHFHKFRGKYELLATYHPAALLRHPKWKRPTWEDVQMLRERYDELVNSS